MAHEIGYRAVAGSRRREKSFTLKVAGLMVFLIMALAVVLLYVIPKMKATLPEEHFIRWNEGVHRQVSCGRIKGEKVILRDGMTIYSFKGIPYATPPVGKLRWKATKSLKEQGKCWHGVLHADKFGSQCMQYCPTSQEPIGNEDCLYLNIWTPAFSDSANLPVVVYFHGGGMITGSGEVHGLSELVKEGIVGVSINYRLNAFGFLTLNEFYESNPDEITSNFGFVDQIEALKWVRDNIRVFGGNPNQVTIAGFSAGAKSVLALLVSPLANGLFNKALSISAPTVYKFKRSRAAADNSIFIRRANCNKGNASSTLKCLHALSSRDVLKAIPWKEYPTWSYMEYGKLPTKGVLSGALAVIDDKVIPTMPTNLNNLIFTLKAKIPIMFGSEAQEMEPNSSFMKNMTASEVASEVKRTLGTFGSTLANDVITEYGIGEQNPSNGKALITVGTDCRMVCQANIYAKNASLSSNHILYRYVVTNHPSKPLRVDHRCCYNFSFHGWDLDALLGFKYYEKLSYTPSSSDLAFATSLRSNVISFIKTGKPAKASWLPYPKSYMEYGAGYTKTIEDSEYHEKGCKLLMGNGVYDYGWML